MKLRPFPLTSSRTLMTLVAVTTALAGARLLAACATADVDPRAQADGGVDVVSADGAVDTMGPDARLDAPRDAPPDAPLDASDDAARDAGPDAVVDAGPDAVVDAGPDAVVDAGPDAGPISAARLHELYLDRNLEGDRVEYVEIAAPPGTPLDALSLRVFDGAGALKATLRVADLGATMKPSGYWLVGSSWVAPDKTHSLSAWGLPNDGGSVQLVEDRAGSPALVDVVGYGAAPTSTSAGAPTLLVEGAAAALPASGNTNRTIGRRAVPGDTGSNAADFCVMTATPGAANGGCL